VSKRELLEHLYDYNWEHHSNVIEAHVSNLRKKLDAAVSESGADPSPVIETMRGRGYRMANWGSAVAALSGDPDAQR
jgi:two-component system response regulator PhoP